MTYIKFHYLKLEPHFLTRDSLENEDMRILS